MAQPFGELPLAEVPVGARVRVIAVGGTRRLRLRLMEMGLLPGVALDVVRRAPLGDPVELRLRGYSLCVRRGDAEAITVQVLARPSHVPTAAIADLVP